MGSEIDLARFIVNASYDDLPNEAIKACKRDILDTIGVGIAGSSSRGIREVANYAVEMKGKESSTILADGIKVPPVSAALVNGSMCHALDYDDTHDKAVLHTGAVVIPASLAIAEYVGSVSGKDLITAVTLGIEIHCRLGLATKLWIGWMLTPLYGYFGAATAVGKLLGLSEKELLSAWGISYSLAAGNTEMIVSGGLTKRIQAGFAASGGVLSALLARRGISGSESSFEGEAGLFNLYQRGMYDSTALTRGLGKTFEVTNLSFKPYPCCRFNHSAIKAALEITRIYNINPEEIVEVRVGLSSAGYINNCEPIEVKKKPRNIVDAQFSIPYGVACALVRRRLNLADLSDEMVRDPKVLEVASKVNCYVDPDIEEEAGRDIAPSIVELHTKAGNKYSFKIDIPPGHPFNPMTDDDLKHKFQDCALSEGVPAKKAENLVNILNDLELLDNISHVTKLFHLHRQSTSR